MNIENIPNQPGCYLMKNKDNVIIYVGKANNLKQRVKSYFNKKVSGKTKKLVSETTDIDYLIVENETEALILELNLIKKHRPKYNILMRDDKTYPYIYFANEKEPTLKIVRRLNKKNQDKLYGPYPNVYAARKMVNILNRLYPMRKCSYYAKKPCLYYHLGQCLGYCKYAVSEKQITSMKKEIKSFLNGNSQIVIDKITSEMQQASLKQNYEVALELKNMLTDIEKSLIKQKVELNDLTVQDVFGFYQENNFLAIVVLFLRGGKIVASHSQMIEMVEEQETELVRYISQFYQKNPLPKTIITELVNQDLLTNYLKVNINIPKKGQKKKLLQMASENAKIILTTNLKKQNQDQNTIKDLKKLLNLKKLNRIEVFDNSTLMGNQAVSGMIVYQDGKFLKDQYRKFKITDIQNDYHSMQEVIYRRYYRVLFDNLEKPDLIVVDGGIIQVKAALKVLNDLKINIPVVGVVKNEKHQTRGLIYQNKEYQLKDEVYRFMAMLQAEVHRFAISYHRQIRSKKTFASQLDQISLIGEKTKNKLLKRFQTVENIKKASDDELREVLNKKALANLRKHLGDDKND